MRAGARVSGGGAVAGCCCWRGSCGNMRCFGIIWCVRFAVAPGRHQCARARHTQQPTCPHLWDGVLLVKLDQPGVHVGVCLHQIHHKRLGSPAGTQGQDRMCAQQGLLSLKGRDSWLCTLLLLVLVVACACSLRAPVRAVQRPCCMHAQAGPEMGGCARNSSCWSLWPLPQRSPLGEQSDQPIPVAIPQGRVVGAPQVCLCQRCGVATTPSISRCLISLDPGPHAPRSRAHESSCIRCCIHVRSALQPWLPAHRPAPPAS